MLITTCSWESMILRLFGRAGDDLIEYRNLFVVGLVSTTRDFVLFHFKEILNFTDFVNFDWFQILTAKRISISANGLLDAWNSVYFKSQNVGNSFFHSRRENGRVE
ncbi:unnamed protein product [Rhizophagus irregularis]|nr:unnamed protein product [Rhizophagus irregularis]CAB4434113.1 unnamed protein product [Rhizophagus irregularis]